MRFLDWPVRGAAAPSHSSLPLRLKAGKKPLPLTSSRSTSPLQPSEEFLPRAYALAFRAAHRAFIIADNFFRIAALIGLRPVVFLETAVRFLGLPFCFAHQAFFAAPILARAAGLMRRRFLTLAGLAWLLLGGRPRRAGWEPSPTRAAIALSLIHI